MNGVKEIGGYFGMEIFGGEEYHRGLIGVNSGRNALLYIIKARRINKLYIPRFLCDSIAQLCVREKIAYEEYGVGKDFLPVFDKTLKQNEYLYIVNYYGQISNEQIANMKLTYGNIIMDNVQAFFQKPVKGTDTIYSCRKFFGVPDGGYASTAEILPEKPERDISMNRTEHLIGRLEENASAYYSVYKRAEDLFYTMPLREMSEFTRNIMRGIDYESVRTRRNANYAVLERKLGIRNGLRLKRCDGPFCYPFYCGNGAKIKARLADEKIYISTLWPNVLQYGGALEKDYAENILPLPCDQRYTAEDMERLAERILL